MTEEQIKQNAEAYAELLTAGNKEHYRTIYTAAKEGYIACAHSLDEEIKELQNELESLREGFYEQGNKLKELIKKLMLANNKLRNPWISVEERLPEKSNENKNYSVNCIVRYTDEYLFPGQVFYTEAYYDYGYEKKSPYNKGGWVATYNNEEHFFFSDYEEHGCVVTHWMPIPKLEN